MDFDEQGFRRAAKAAGHTDEEINAVVAKETGGKDTFAKGPGGYELGTPKQAEEKLGGDWWKLPAATAVLGAAAGAAPGIYKSLKDKMSTPEISRTTEPTMTSPLTEKQAILQAHGQPIDLPISKSDLEILKNALPVTDPIVAAPTAPVTASPTVAAPAAVPVAPAPVAPTVQQPTNPALETAPVEPVAETKTRAPKRTPEQIELAKREGPTNWLKSQLGGDENYKAFVNQYNQGKPFASMEEAYGASEKYLGGPKKSEFIKSVKGIPTMGQMEVGPVKPSEEAIARLAKTGRIKGGVTPGMLATMIGAPLAALGGYQAYKEGKETGDWTNLGLMGGSLLGGASLPGQAAYQAATYMKPAGESREELKALGERLKSAQQAFKTGGGQGKRGVPPP